MGSFIVLRENSVINPSIAFERFHCREFYLNNLFYNCSLKFQKILGCNSTD